MYEDVPNNHYSPPACKFLKKNGWCQFGDDCRFRHDLTFAPTSPSLSFDDQRGGGGGENRRGGRGRGGNLDVGERGFCGNVGSNRRENVAHRPPPIVAERANHFRTDNENQGRERDCGAFSRGNSRNGENYYRRSGRNRNEAWESDRRPRWYDDRENERQAPRYDGDRRGTGDDNESTDDKYRHQRAYEVRRGEARGQRRDQRGGAGYRGRPGGRGRAAVAFTSTAERALASTPERTLASTAEKTLASTPEFAGSSERTEVDSKPTVADDVASRNEVVQSDDSRATEIRQLLRRFPKTIADQNGVDFAMDFESSDPDWPYDVATIGINIRLPAEYPSVPLEVTVPDMFPANLPVPEVLRQYAEEEIQKWIRVRFDAMKANCQKELAARPFFRWLDRNMEAIFTEGLIRTKREIANQASGFKFIRNEADEAEKESQKPSSHEEEEGEEEDEDVEAEDEDGEDDGSVDEGEEDQWTDEEGEVEDDMAALSLMDGESKTSDDTSAAASTAAAKPNCQAPLRKGTEVKLVGLELGENVALLRLVALALVAQCVKCKKKVDVALGPSKTLAKTCEKCRTAMTIQFRPALAHVHSPVVGFLDIFGATPFDLNTTNSKFSPECLNCNKGQSPMGLHSGKSGNSSFCSHCHARLNIAFSSIKFTALVVNEAFVPKTTPSVKQQKKIAASMGIREGYPLPQSGTCQHYKKSFRWLRFSCCGRVFPCDLCHEEEIKDHEPDFAPKMICGHCSKEQPFFKDKPCISCGESTTRPRSSHWEGGKGCRNKLKMAATDKQKYRNCNKTVSRKTQEKLDAAKPGNDKKETKLRHT